MGKEHGVRSLVARVFKHPWQLSVLWSSMLAIICLANSPRLAVWLLSYADSAAFFSVQRYLSWDFLTVFTLVHYSIPAAFGLYHSRQRGVLLSILVRVIFGGLCGWAILAFVLNFSGGNEFANHWLFVSSLIASLQLLIIRVLLEKLSERGWFKKKVLILGAGRRAANLLKLRRRTDRRGFKVVGFVICDGDAEHQVPSAQCVNVGDDLLKYCSEHLIDEIVVAMDDRRISFPMHELFSCRLDGIKITELIEFLERETGKVFLDAINPSWMIFSDGFGNGRWHSLLERLADLFASTLLLLITSPVMLLTVLAIKLEDGLDAPVLYRQIRVGAHNKEFRLFKFRSMCIDAEPDGQAVWATQADSRVTKVGRVIRGLRIDELPQVINVFRGEMSFVGPRPERPEFYDRLEDKVPYYRERAQVKPGITGWAQICYPYGSTDKDAVEKLQYDLYYIKNHNLLLYFLIIMQTVEVIVWRKGAR